MMDLKQSTTALAKLAIDLALSQNWEEAIVVNKALIEKIPNDVAAKLRLGKSYLQLKKFKEAEKLFKEVIKLDPINIVAKKNLDLAKNKKSVNGIVKISEDALIKEPGTTQSLDLKITYPRFMADKLTPGNSFNIKLLKNRIDLVEDKKVIASILDKIIIRKIHALLETSGERVTVRYISGEAKDIKVLIKASQAIFKADKQDVKSYIKGQIDDVELELPVSESDME